MTLYLKYTGSSFWELVARANNLVTLQKIAKEHAEKCKIYVRYCVIKNVDYISSFYNILSLKDNIIWRSDSRILVGGFKTIVVNERRKIVFDNSNQLNIFEEAAKKERLK